MGAAGWGFVDDHVDAAVVPVARVVSARLSTASVLFAVERAAHVAPVVAARDAAVEVADVCVVAG